MVGSPTSRKSWIRDCWPLRTSFIEHQSQSLHLLIFIRLIAWQETGYETRSTGCKHCGNANSWSKTNIFSYLRTSAFLLIANIGFGNFPIWSRTESLACRFPCFKSTHSKLNPFYLQRKVTLSQLSIVVQIECFWCG